MIVCLILNWRSQFLGRPPSWLPTSSNPSVSASRARPSLGATGRPLLEYVQELIEDTETLPALVRSVDRAIVGVLLRQGVPGAAAVQTVEDRLQHPTRVDPLSAKAAWRVIRLEHRADALPCLI